MAWTVHNHLPGLALDGPARIDAYLAWDLLTQQARHRQQDRSGAWVVPGFAPVMLEFNPGQTLTDWCLLPAVLASADDLRAAFAPSLALGGGSRVHTAVLPTPLLACLLAGVDGGVLLRFQLGALCHLAAGHPPAQAMPAPLPASLPASTTTRSVLRTLGVIDDGCCLAHQALRTVGPQGAISSRVLALWDQEPAARSGPPGPWRRCLHGGGAAPYGYGVELSCEDISRLLTAQPGLGEAGERAFYRSIHRPQWGAPGRDHGARVLHLLAGPRRSPPGTAAGTAAAGKPPAGAESLPLIFVQLPSQTVADTSGDSIGMHVVDGARCIAARSAERAGPARPWAATVNISLGSLAGPHDGTSMAEQALADLSADARVAVVVAAGNLPPRSRVHGQRLVQPGQPGRFTVRLPPGIQRDSFVEFWLPNHGVDTALLAVQVLAPPALGLAPLRLAVGECAALGPAAKVQAGVVWARAVAQGLNGSLLLLAIAPTSPGPDPDRAQARPGFWTVEISTQGQQALEVHGWVERDDVLIGSRRAQQIRFEPDRQAGATAGYINNRHTLTHLAHGAGVTVAGGYVVSTQRAASGSARGPLRGARQASQPAWYAPIAQSPSLPGIAVAGFFSGRRSRIGGTSAAAPQVARALVEAAMAAERTPAKAGRSAKPADQAAKPAYPTCKPATGRPRLWPPADDPDSDAMPPNAQVL